MEGKAPPQWPTRTTVIRTSTDIWKQKYSARDPVKLVCMLYRGAIEATAAARRHLQARAIRERSREILRAYAILRRANPVARTRNIEEIEMLRPRHLLYAYMQTLPPDGECPTNRSAPS